MFVDKLKNELLIEASREGYRAYLDGFELKDNPYNKDEEWDFHIEWNEGWNNAAWDD